MGPDASPVKLAVSIVSCGAKSGKEGFRQKGEYDFKVQEADLDMMTGPAGKG